MNMRGIKLALLATVIPERTWEEMREYERMRDRCADLARGDWVRCIGLAFYFGMLGMVLRQNREPSMLYLTAALEGWWLNDCHPPDLLKWFATHRALPVPAWLVVGLAA